MDENLKELIIITFIVAFLLGLSLGLLFNIEPVKANFVSSEYENTEIAQHLDVLTHIRSTVLIHSIIENEIRYWHYGNPSDEDVRRKATLLYGYALRYDLNPFFITALAITESNLTQNITSYAGAIGIMQLMPRTANYLEVNPYTLEGNIKGGVKFIRQLINKYDCPNLALAHYNAGVNPERKIHWKPVSSYVWNINNIMSTLQRRYEDELGKRS